MGPYITSIDFLLLRPPEQPNSNPQRPHIRLARHCLLESRVMVVEQLSKCKFVSTSNEPQGLLASVNISKLGRPYWGGEMHWTSEHLQPVLI